MRTRGPRTPSFLFVADWVGLPVKTPPLLRTRNTTPSSLSQLTPQPSPPRSSFPLTLSTTPNLPLDPLLCRLFGCTSVLYCNPFLTSLDVRVFTTIRQRDLPNKTWIKEGWWPVRYKGYQPRKESKWNDDPQSSWVKSGTGNRCRTDSVGIKWQPRNPEVLGLQWWKKEKYRTV